MSPEDASLIWYPGGTAVALVAMEFLKVRNPWWFPWVSSVLGAAYGIVNNQPGFALFQLITFVITAMAGMRWIKRSGSI